MRLILFRHGHADEADPARWPDDRERPLSARGAERTADAARGLATLEERITRVITSPLRRARETAGILAGELAIDAPFETHDALAPGGSVRQLLETLPADHVDDTLVLVGHEPDLGKLAGTLLFGAPKAIPLKKAGACAIAFEGPAAPGAGRLAWFLPPKALRRLGKRQKERA
jgi:phosphohistidine phosphatase